MRIVIAVLTGLVLAGSPAAASEGGPDCPALVVSAAFVSAQFHAGRVNPVRAEHSLAPALALQNANWAKKMAVVFEALVRQSKTDAGRAAFLAAKSSMNGLAAEEIQPPGKEEDSRGPVTVARQLNAISNVEQRLRSAFARSCQ